MCGASATIAAWSPGPHVEEMEAAVRLDGEGQRLLLDGDRDAGRTAAGGLGALPPLLELAPPRSYGRLVGMLKAAVIAGEAAEAAAYAREQVGEADSRRAHYVVAVAALVRGRRRAAAAAAEGMRAGLAGVRPRRGRDRRARGRGRPRLRARRCARSSPTSRAATSTSPACRSPTRR